MTATYCTTAQIVLVEPRASEHWPDQYAADFEDQRVEAKRKIDLALERKGIDPGYIQDPETYLRDAEVFCVLADLCWASRERGMDDTWRDDWKRYAEAYEKELERPINLSLDGDDSMAPSFLPRIRNRRC